MSTLNLVAFASLFVLAFGAINATNSSIVSIPPEYTYLLPNNFDGNSNYTFVNGTHTSSAEINALFAEAKKAPFISYDQEFLDILGPNPEVKLIAQTSSSTDYEFHEMGVWVPATNEVWFCSDVSSTPLSKFPPTLYALNLETNAIRVINGSKPIINANGGYYYDGKVWIGTYPDNKNQGWSGGIISVDPITLEVETVVNSYFGLRFNGIDDIVWTTDGENSYMFFTDLNFAYQGYHDLPPIQLPANVYRWDPQNQVVLPVISRNDVNPNGVRVSPDMKTLYVTDSVQTFSEAGPFSPASGPGDAFWLGPYVYAYDLDSNMLPVNKRLFSMARQGLPDGIHCDDAGRVWTGEYEGAVVRNAAGKTIGVFNAQFFQEDKTTEAEPFANFALAGDTVVFLSTTRLWTIKLAQTVVAANSPIVNRRRK